MATTVTINNKYTCLIVVLFITISNKYTERNFYYNLLAYISLYYNLLAYISADSVIFYL